MFTNIQMHKVYTSLKILNLVLFICYEQKYLGPGS